MASQCLHFEGQALRLVRFPYKGRLLLQLGTYAKENLLDFCNYVAWRHCDERVLNIALLILLTGKAKHCDQKLSHCHFVHLNSYVDWPGIEPDVTNGDIRTATK